MSEKIRPETVVTRVNDLPSAPVDTDIVILNMARGIYVGLDEIGRRIWEVLQAPTRVDELCRRMSDEYSGNSEDIARDVMKFLDELRSEGLVTFADGSGDRDQ